MTDPILYLSMLLGLGGVYVLISYFHDDDDGDDDGEKYIYSLEHLNLEIVYLFIKNILSSKSFLKKMLLLKIVIQE